MFALEHFETYWSAWESALGCSRVLRSALSKSGSEQWWFRLEGYGMIDFVLHTAHPIPHGTKWRESKLTNVGVNVARRLREGARCQERARALGTRAPRTLTHVYGKTVSYSPWKPDGAVHPKKYRQMLYTCRYLLGAFRSRRSTLKGWQRMTIR